MSNALNRAILATALAIFASAAQADTDYQVDNIFDLNGVRDIALDGPSGNVVVTLANKILQFSTFPLEVIADVNVNMDGVTSILTEDNTLVVMGDDTQGNLDGGSILVYQDIQKSLSENIEPLGHPLPTTPFSQSILTEDGQVFAVNPTWFSVVQYDVPSLVEFVPPDSRVETWKTNDVFLQCGTASKVSVFKHNDSDFYVTSVTGRKLLEFGPVELNNRSPSGVDCFSPASASRSVSAAKSSVNGQSLLHELVKSPSELYEDNAIPKRVLTYDPDTALLSLFPFREFRGRVAILRSERLAFDLTPILEETGVPANRFALMSASNDATLIYISYLGSTVVHRLREFDGALEYVGRIDLNSPVKLINISDDGRLAAIVTGALRRGQSDEITLIKHPREIEGSGPLKRERFSVLNMQKLLVAQGCQLLTDGVYGDQTQKAVDLVLTKGACDTPAPATRSLGGTRSLGNLTGAGADQAGLEEFIVESSEDLSIGNNLRGLFPLDVYGPSR